MSKALRTAAFVVGAVALASTGFGLAAGAGVFGAGLTAAGATAATAATLGTIASVGTIASLTSGVLGLAAGLTAKKPEVSSGHNMTEWSSPIYDPSKPDRAPGPGDTPRGHGVVLAGWVDRLFRAKGALV